MRKLYPVLNMFTRKNPIQIGVFLFLFFSINNSTAFGQIVWSQPASGGAWLSPLNWTGGTVPGTTGYAQFQLDPSGAGNVGIDLNGATNNGVKNQAVGGIEITGSRAVPLIIGNSTTTAGVGYTLTLNGTTINSVPDVILRNNTSQLVTIKNTAVTGNKTMSVALGNATNNIINIDGTGGITISSIITGPNKLTKDGSGTGELLLAGLNTYSGGTIITAGTLTCGATNTIPASGGVTLNGGTLSTVTTTVYNQNAGVLTLTENSVIALGTGNRTLRFSASNAAAWTAGKTINITGWVGAIGTAATTSNPKIFVGTTAAGLTAAQLSQISFNGVYGAALLSTGQLVPAPSITSLGASSGCQGTSITINGTNFTGATAANVKIGVTAVTSITSNDGSTIVAVIGAGTTGAVTVKVGSATGTSASTFTVILQPSTSTNGGNKTVCKGATSAALGGNTPVSGSGLWTCTAAPIGGNTGDISFTSATTGNTTAIVAPGAVEGAYTLQWTISTSCNSSASSLTLTVNPNKNAGTVTGTTPLCIGGTATYTSNGDAGGVWSSTNTVVATVNSVSGLVTAKAAGTANITYTISSGCNTPVSAFQTLTVSPNANAGVVSGTSPMCVGSTATYSSNGDAGGTWSSSNTLRATVDAAGVVTAIAAGAVNIIYTVNTGCNAPKSALKALTVSTSAIWVGGSSVWNTGSNWCSGAVPIITSDVIIPSGTPNDPVISSGITATVRNINIAAGASLTVTGTGILRLAGAITNSGTLDLTDGTLDLAANAVSVKGISFSTATVKNLKLSGTGTSSVTTGAGNNLNVTGFVEFTTSNKTFNTNGNLTLISNAAGTASIKDITNNGTLTGNTITGSASVECYISSGRKYRFLSVNTLGSGLTVQNSWMEGQAAGVNGGPAGYGTWITGRSVTGFDENTTAPTVKWWNGTSYTGITDPTLYDIRSHTAYMVYVRGDRSATVSNGITTATVLRTTGTLSQGNTGTTTIAAGTDYIAVANPYASAVDLTKLTYSDNGASTINIKVWDPQLSGSFGLGGFQTLTKAPGDPDFTMVPGGGSYGGASILNTIESGQAFFMQGSGSSRDISFNERAKTPKAYDVFFAAGQQQKLSGILSVRGSGNMTTVADGIMVLYKSIYNTAADPDDARKLDNGNDNVSIKRDGQLLTVEYRNVPAAEDTVKINIANMQVKNYQWKFTLDNMDAPGRVGYLKDLYLGTSTLLNLNGINIIDFSVTSNAASAAADRFLIVFKPANVLAANMTSISATRKPDGNIDVKWQAESELSIDHYETERSADGRSFMSIGNTIPANNAGGRANYVYTDNNPLNTINYYRIKAIGNNGSIQQTAIVKVGPITKEGMITVYPNPINGTTATVSFENKVSGKYSLQVINNGGQKIYTEEITLQSNNEVKQINFVKPLAAGVYQLIIISPEGKRETKQIISK